MQIWLLSVMLKLFILFWVKLINIQCQNKVYPDYFKSRDFPFYKGNQELIGDIDKYHLIKAGYYVTNETHTDLEQKIYVKKLGIIFHPQELEVPLGTTAINDPLLVQEFIKDDISNSLSDNNRYSEMVELLQGGITFDREVSYNFELKYIIDSQIVYSYSAPIKFENGFTIAFKAGTSEAICEFNIGDGAGYLEIEIQKTKIVCEIKTNNNQVKTIDDNISLGASTSVTVTFKGRFSISYYYLTLNINNKDDEYVHSYSGRLPNQFDNPCIPGYFMNGNECKKCHNSCYECMATNDCTSCSRLTEGTENKPQNGECPINYINLVGFGDIKARVLKPPDTNRITLGFWTFIDNLNNAGRFFHVHVEKFLTISIRGQGTGNADASADVRCTVQTNYIGEENIEAFLLANQDHPRFVKGTVGVTPPETLNGRWFFSQCAMSFDHEAYYLNTIINNKDNVIDKPIPYEYITYDAQTAQSFQSDVHFRQVFEENDEHYINIRGASRNEGAHIYLRNMVLFKEYLPHQIHWMYTDFSKSADPAESSCLFGTFMVSYVLPLNLIIKKGDKKYQMNGYSKSLNNTVDLEMELKPGMDENDVFGVPLNFKQLPLLSRTGQTQFDDVGLATETQVGCESAEFCCAFDKPIFCKSNNYLHGIINQEGKTEYECTNDCTNSIMFPGEDKTSGVCSYNCIGSVRCDENYDYSNLCSNNPNIYNLYYHCVPDDREYTFYYSSEYNPGSIKLPFNDLNSYIIEFWYYPDFGFDTDSAFRSKHKPIQETKKFYIFISTHLRVYYQIKGAEHFNKVFYFESDFQIAEIDPRISTKYEWMKISLMCKFEDERYTLSGYINNELDNEITLGSTSGAPQRLTGIYFCTELRGGCENGVYEWGSGYYKDLRVWNADYISLHSALQITQTYGKEITIQGLVAYYPLTGKYIAYNTLYTYDSEIKLTGKTEPQLRRFNYASQFDYTKKELPLYSFLDENGETALSCEGNCFRCFGKSKCYECIEQYALQGNKCVLIEYYFATLPAKDSNGANVELTISHGPLPQTEITITFWIKLYGNSGEDQNYDIFYYSDTLKIKYNGDMKNNLNEYGLCLVYKDNTIIARDKSYREQFGKWTFISLSYYRSYRDDSLHDTRNYFPLMMKFELGDTSLPIKYPDSNVEFSQLEFSPFKIPGTVYCKIFRFIIYDKFISGAYSLEANFDPFPNGYPFPLPIGPTQFVASFVDTCSGVTCTFDTHPIPTQATGPNIILYDTGVDRICPKSCANKCYGLSEQHCTCLMDNRNSQMFIDNDGAHYCKKFDYLNWANSEVTIPDVSYATGTKPSYTLQFWVFAYEYMPNQMNILEFHWEHHTYLQIHPNENGNGYLFTCYPFKKDEAPSISISYNINKWNFISCATNFEEQLFFASTLETEKRHDVKDIIDIPDALTKLLFKDYNEKEWGVLFFRQIRLWNAAYSKVKFLSHLNITNPEYFQYLMNEFEPKFNEEFVVQDIKNNTVKAKVETKGKLGINKVNLIDYESLDKLCEDNGEYYDETTQQCLTFLDLSKMNDITFGNIPLSYSGDYTLAFWFFAEDYSSLSKGIHVQWTKHVQISILYNGERLVSYCFPKGYRSDYYSNSDINAKIAKGDGVISNFYMESPSELGWQYFICSVSFYSMKVILNTEDAKLESDVLYVDEDGNKHFNDFAFKYYFSTSSDSESQINLQSITNPNSKIYFRSVQAFSDFIPMWFDIRNMDLSVMKAGEFPSLVFVSNFARIFNETAKNDTVLKLKLEYCRYPKGMNGPERVCPKLLLNTSFSFFEHSANFEYRPLCDPSFFYGQKYNKETNLCESITNCAGQDQYYCLDEGKHLACKRGYITNPDNDGPICGSTCSDGTMRLPGTHSENGICSSDIYENKQQDASITFNDYMNTVKCESDYVRSGYKCYKSEDVTNSSLYYSRCHNPPNIYRTIATGTKQKLVNGYYYEFWFMFDTVNNKCIGENTKDIKKEYYLYSLPHSIYYDHSRSQYIVSTYTETAPVEFYPNEWNQVVIKTVLSGKQYVEYYINGDFSKDPIRFDSFSVTDNLQLASISFCSRNENGDCINGKGFEHVWGSAYYKDIRVWDLKSTSLELIKAKNNFLFSEYTTSLILYYPLTLDKMDVNVISEVIIGVDNIVATHAATQNFHTEDNFLFYNFAMNFDYPATIKEKPYKFVSSLSMEGINVGDCSEHCTRCYDTADTKCYNCTVNAVLIDNTCKLIQTYFVKTPIDDKENDVEVSLSSDQGSFSFTDAKGWTITFYMKFFGVSSMTSSYGTQPPIFTLSSDTLMKYDIATTNLIFSQGSDAFVDDQFGSYIGKWIPIAIASYKSNVGDVYPSMLTFAVNRRDIPFKPGFTFSKNGFVPTNLKLGGHIVALYSSFRVYDVFVQGAYDLVNAGADPRITYSFQINQPTDGCYGNLQITEPPKCVKNYHDYESQENCAPNNNQYVDPSLIDSGSCGNCDSKCITHCFNAGDKSCTCDLSYGLYWLRRTTGKLETYCERVPYIDFSMLDDIEFHHVPNSDKSESTVEFWIFIYSYNTEDKKFTKIEIEWNLHNKVEIYNENNTLFAKCYAIYDKNDTGKYPEFILDEQLSFHKWNLVRCGTDYASEKKMYFMGTQEKDLLTQVFPNRTDKTSISIRSTVENANYGFLFLREMKFWRQYNYNYIDTRYININNFSKYKGLLVYFKNINNLPTKLEMTQNSLPKAVTLKDEIKFFEGVDKTADPVEYSATFRSEFTGYNYVDPNNAGYYSELILCEEGSVYNTATNNCIKPTMTKCEYPGDISDKCITCPPKEQHIFPEDGTCMATCPIGYYNDSIINQCRKCHSTCYTCYNFTDTSCLSCNQTANGEILRLVEHLGKCVPDCEVYGLTVMKSDNYRCCLFDISGEIQNLVMPIDNNTFTEIVVKLFNSTTREYKVLWGFDLNETIKLNEGRETEFKNLTLSPFADNATLTYLEDIEGSEDSEGNKKKLTIVKINPEFFKVGNKYAMYVNVTATNEDINATVTKQLYFNLIMNSPPQNGSLDVVPPVGLYNTTTFIFSCINWNDDVAGTNLLYRFTSEELRTNTIHELSPWSGINEIYRNFTVVYYQLPESIVRITCQIMDNMGIITTISQNISIANSIYGGVFTLEKALEHYKLPDTSTPAMLLARSEFLKSLGLDTYKSLQPERMQSKYEPSLDQSYVTINDPECNSDFCNGKGECGIVDEFIVCHCSSGYLGRNCQLEQTVGYPPLEKAIIELYNKIFSGLQNEITYEECMAIHNIYFSTQFYFRDTSFFSKNLESFLTLSMNLFGSSILNNTAEYLDLIDYYYSYELIRLNKERANNKYMGGSPYRNITLTKKQTEEFEVAFPQILELLKDFLAYLVNQYKSTSRTFIYESSNFYIAISMINPTFNDTLFFENRTKAYRSKIEFMECLNYIEIDRLANPYYQAWMIYIEYLSYPFGYLESLSINHTSPIVELKFIDASTMKEIKLNECNDRYQIKISMPFTSYTWLSELNRQKWLYDPNNYKTPDDPIFSDPIHIDKKGVISNDTIEDRIEKYNRLYNFSCTFYDEDLGEFSEEGLDYLNFTADSNYIVYASSHLTMFTTFFKENNMEFKTQSRFFYIARPQLFKHLPNYNNYAFFTIIVVFGLYFLLWITLGCYDKKKYQRQYSLYTLKHEITKALIVYKKEPDKNRIAFNMVPRGFAEIEGNIGLSDKADDLAKPGNANEKFNALYGNNRRFKDGEKNDFDVLTLNKIKEKSEEERSEDDEDNGDSNNEDMKEYKNKMEYEKKHDLNQKRKFFRKSVHNPFNDEHKQMYVKANTTTNNDSTLKYEDNDNDNDFHSSKNNSLNDDNNNNNNNVNTNGNEHIVNEEANAEKKKEKEKKDEIKLYNQLHFSYCEFVCYNIRDRNLFVTTFINPSLFNPRWRKLTLFITEMCIHMIMNSVQLTQNENAQIKLKVELLIQIAFVSTLVADCFMYLLVFFFLVPEKRMKELFDKVQEGKQLVVLREYQQLNSRMNGFVFLGFVICMCIWTFAFYISVGFVAVWKVQKVEWVVCVVIAFCMDFVLFEIVFELIIGIFYSQRETNEVCTKICIFLDKVRNYRCLSK